MPTITIDFDTAGSFNWTAPLRITGTALVECWGNGGNGGTNGAGGGNPGGGGGGGGSYAAKTITPFPGVTYAGQVGQPSATSTVRRSWFVSAATVNAPGGTNAATEVAGSGGTGGTGDTTFNGGNGATGVVGTPGGGGGSATSTANGNNGSGGTGGTGQGNGGNSNVDGSAPGGGGGGATPGLGGKVGASGRVRITYTLTNPSTARPVVARDPMREQRLRRFTEGVATVINALAERGELQQVDHDDWTVSGTTSDVLAGVIFAPKGVYGMLGG